MTLDDDRQAILTAERQTRDGIAVRLHGSFLDAPHRILDALVRFLRRPEPHLRQRVQRLYRGAGLARVGGGERAVVLRHTGHHFDLKVLFDTLNERYFDGKVEAFVTWGRRTNSSRRSRSIHFGSYNWARRVIRIHPDLDRGFVPRYFLESVLYHEMLHAHLGMGEGRGGNRGAHGTEFRRLERAWPGYERAKAWEKAHLHHFLKSARRRARVKIRA